MNTVEQYLTIWRESLMASIPIGDLTPSLTTVQTQTFPWAAAD